MQVRRRRSKDNASELASVDAAAGKQTAYLPEAFQSRGSVNDSTEIANVNGTLETNQAEVQRLRDALFGRPT